MASGSRVVRDHEKKMLAASNRYGSWSSEEHIFNLKHVAERKNRNNVASKSQSPTPVTSSSSEAILPKPTQTVPLTGVKYSNT